MSVVVRMEMPKNCFECPFSIIDDTADGAWCNALANQVYGYAERDDDCPIIMDRINAIPAATRWVRCEERMPEKNGAYLVFIGYGDKWIWFKDIYKDGKFMADTCALNGAKVTHWMPIEPPKEDA